MGCGLSTSGSKDQRQTSTLHDTQNPSLLLAKQKMVPTPYGFDANAQIPSSDKCNQHCTLKLFDEAPPSYDASQSALPVGFKGFPAGVMPVLNILKTAAKLTHFGHRGAWAALKDRHGQIWLDSAYTLWPSTYTAILLYATVLLLVGKALGSNMVFYFTTFPNLETEQLSALELETLKALREVCNAKSFRKACEHIHQHRSALAKQGLEDFIRDEANFLDEDTQDEKLIKLLKCTREKMKKLWHGWDSSDLDFKKLQSLYKCARKASRDQPKLLNNTSFIYQMAVHSYRRQVESNVVYPLTCTFLLGTRLEPVEVDAIEKSQIADRKAATQERENKKGFLRRKPTQLEPDSAGENPRSVVKELELVGHQFCIQAVVFNDELNDQAIAAYKRVDNFLHGQPDDINDVTYVSEEDFLCHFLSPTWVFKTTTSHDPRVDSWEELQTKPKYNEELIADENNVIWLPSPKLIRRSVFGMPDEDDDDNDDDEEDQFSKDKTRTLRPAEITLAHNVRLGTPV
jgi:hypothetical protein